MAQTGHREGRIDVRGAAGAEKNLHECTTCKHGNAFGTCRLPSSVSSLSGESALSRGDSPPMPNPVRWLILACFAVGAATPVASQATAKPSDRARLLQLEDSWATALIKRDGRAFRRMPAPGFVYTEDDR